MGYTNTTIAGAYAQERNTADLVAKLNKTVAASVDGVKEHEELRAAFKQQAPEMRQKLIRGEIQNLGTALAMLRNYGLTIEDIARLITTA